MREAKCPKKVYTKGNKKHKKKGENLTRKRDPTKKAEKLTKKREKKYTSKEMDLTKKSVKHLTRKRYLTKKKAGKAHQEGREKIHNQRNGSHQK